MFDTVRAMPLDGNNQIISNDDNTYEPYPYLEEGARRPNRKIRYEYKNEPITVLEMIEDIQEQIYD